jgi:hypothetical protein
MDILRKHFYSTVYQAPDSNAAADDTPPDPPAGDPAPADDGGGDPPAPAGGEPTHGNKGGTPWFMKRISDVTERARTAEERAATAERKAADATALAERLQRGTDTNAPPAPRAEPPQDIDGLVNQRVAQRHYQDTVNHIIARGNNAFGRSEFTEASNTLGAIAGEHAPDLVNAIHAVDPDKAHELLFNLGKDPERTAELVGMDPARRIVELTRMSMTAAPAVDPKTPPKPPVPPVKGSRAPAPPPPIDNSASKVKDWRSDDASDEEFDAGYFDPARLAKRAARLR